LNPVRLASAGRARGHGALHPHPAGRPEPRAAVRAEGASRPQGSGYARELEILQLIANGMSNREIAEKLFVSENTVKTHSSRLFDKLDAKRRTQAVQRGKELGLIP